MGNSPDGYLDGSINMDGFKLLYRAEYANYDARDFSVDTEKFWLWGQMKF